MIKKLFIKTLFLATLITTSLFSWWDSSHMVIAKIAEENLNFEAKKECHRLASLLKYHFPETPDFITSATWADDMASSGFTGWAWHGTSLPYDPENILSDIQKEKILSGIQNNDAIFGIKQAIKTLKNENANDYAKAIMLRFLLHSVGDIHMPLHCTNRYSNKYPKGDFGGALFKVEYELNSKNSLHSLWDSCLGRDYLRVKRPLTDFGRLYLQEFQDEIQKLYPQAKLYNDLLIKDFDRWAQESHEIGKNHAYQGISEYEKPSDEYLRKNREIAYKQIAKAGYRLADILNDIYK